MFSKNIFTKLFFSASTKWLIYLDIYFITSFMLFIKGKPHKQALNYWVIPILVTQLKKLFGYLNLLFSSNRVTSVNGVNTDVASHITGSSPHQHDREPHGITSLLHIPFSFFPSSMHKPYLLSCESFETLSLFLFPLLEFWLRAREGAIIRSVVEIVAMQVRMVAESVVERVTQS